MNLSAVKLLVAKTNAVIEQAKTDGIMAIECDSTWESGYNYDRVELLKTKIKIFYEEYNGTFENKVDSYCLNESSDLRYALTNVRRCVAKGYREAARLAAKEKKAEQRAEQEAEHAYFRSHPELNP